MKFQIIGILLFLSNLTSAEQAIYGLTEAQFNSAIDRVEAVYAPIVERLGKTLLIDRKWESNSIVAVAMKNFYIRIPGGMGRAEFMTEDALQLFVCHELGHYLGGTPKHTHPNLAWSSVEGQADFYSTSECLKNVFASDDNEILLNSARVTAELTVKCGNAHSHKNDINVCIRSGLAAIAAVTILPGGTEVNINTPDKLIVPVLKESYPTTQCRLDTFIQGALCNSSIEDNEFCERPLCWFKPTE